MSLDYTQADDGVVARLRSMNRALMFCGPSVRYELQRNLIDIVEEMSRHRPLALKYMQVIKDIAQTVVGHYGQKHDVGRVHVALRRVDDLGQRNAPSEAKPSNVESFSNLRRRFSEQAKADHFLVDSQLAKRHEDGELRLTEWGLFVLQYLDDEQEKALVAARHVSEFQPDIAL